MSQQNPGQVVTDRKYGGGNNGLLRRLNSEDPSQSEQHESQEEKDAPGECFITRLPKELLLTIIEDITAQEHADRDPSNPCCCDTHYDKAVLKILALTSRFFYSVATPLLYREIGSRGQSHNRWVSLVPPSPSMQRLLSVLEKNPNLGQHCLTFCANIECNTLDNIRNPAPIAEPSHYAVANSLSTLLPNIRCFIIGGEFWGREESPLPWAFLRKAFSTMQTIEHLELWRGTMFKDVMEHVNLPKLRILDLFGTGNSGPNSDLPSPKRSASFSTLRVSGCSEDSVALRNLLAWPSKLAHFQYSRQSQNKDYLDYAMLHQMLTPHRNYLRTVDIGKLTLQGQGDAFHACDFPHLEFLSLGRRQMPHSLEFTSETADHLLGHSLRRFVWYVNYFASGSCPHFNEQEESWLREFVRFATERGAALREIHIDTDAWILSPPGPAPFPRVYVWDRFDVIAEEASRGGIKVTYPRPRISREKYMKKIAENQREIDRQNGV